jgi:hypothetical protein
MLGAGGEWKYPPAHGCAVSHIKEGELTTHVINKTQITGLGVLFSGEWVLSLHKVQGSISSTKKVIIIVWRCSSVVQHLPSMCEVLGLIPSTTHTNKKILIIITQIVHQLEYSQCFSVELVTRAGRGRSCVLTLLPLKLEISAPLPIKRTPTHLFLFFSGGTRVWT